jgi:IS30 family transposase
MTDRATLITRLQKLTNGNSKMVSKAIIENLNKMTCQLHNITFDNDKRFADHMEIAKVLNVKTYFKRPYTSEEKRTVENRIGQIRRYFPIP